MYAFFSVSVGPWPVGAILFVSVLVLTSLNCATKLTFSNSFRAEDEHSLKLGLFSQIVIS